MKKLVITAALLAALSAAGATAYKATKNEPEKKHTTHVVERNAEAEQYIDYLCYEYYCAALERGETESDYVDWLLDVFCEGDDYEQIVCEAYGITYDELRNLER